MIIQLSLPLDSPKMDIIDLKNLIEKTSINGVEKLQIMRSEHNLGHMGIGDIINSLTAVVEAAEKPLVELIKCLQSFVDNYRTEITIPTKANTNITIKHGRSMSADELKNLITAIQKEL